MEKTFYRPAFNFKLGTAEIKPNLDLRFGLDLAGGASLVFDIDNTNTTTANLPNALESLKTNIERRINLFGVSESNVQISRITDSYRLIVDLPGVSNVNEAIKLIGQTASLKFMGIIEPPPEATATATLKDILRDTGLNGSHLVRASPQPNPNTGAMEVSLEFNPEGTKLLKRPLKNI